MLFTWLTTIKQVGRRPPRGGADGARRGRLPAAHRAARRARRGLADPRARAGHRPVPPGGGARAGGRGRRGECRARPDDRLRRRLRRRGHGAVRALRHRGRRPRQARGPPHRRVAVGGGARARPRPALATFDTLNTWYYADAPRAHRPVLDRARRESTFDEVVLGLDESTALLEARRCMSCGNCFALRQLLRRVPGQRGHQARRARGEYLIDLDYCKGCGICVAECPSGAIQMVPEEI